MYTYKQMMSLTRIFREVSHRYYSFTYFSSFGVLVNYNYSGRTELQSASFSNVSHRRLNLKLNLL